MKKTLFFISLISVFFGCKASQPTGPDGTSSASLADVQNVLDSTEIKFAQIVNVAGTTPQQAIIETESWLKTLPTIQSIADLDSTYIYITLPSGLTTTFSFDQMGADGLSITRGGPAKTKPQDRLIGPSPSRHTLSNKNVLIYSAAASDFYLPGEMDSVLKVLKNSDLGLTVTLLTDSECTYQTIDNLSNYGLVILDTHGTPDAFQAGSFVELPTGKRTDSAMRATFDAQLGAGTYDRILSGDLRISQVENYNYHTNQILPPRYDQISITSKHISTLTNLSNTMIFGNMCYSGTTVMPILTLRTPIATAFSIANPISYYCYGYDNGYSSGVRNDFSKQMEDTLVWDLFVDHDSTGYAYQKIDATRFYDPNKSSKSSGLFYFNHFGSDDYSYMPCIDSFTDVRDGQLYHTICYGNQIWMQENLNYNAPGSFPYDSSALDAAIYGRIYPWKIVMAGAATSNTNPSGVTGVCPYGWHVPSEAEWQELRDTLALGQNEAAALELNSSDTTIGGWLNGTGTNSTGFTALAGGFYNYDNINYVFHTGFTGLHDIALFHTSTLTPNGMPAAIWLSSTSPTAKIDVQPSSSTSDPNQPSSNAYCRCVKDP